MYTENDLVSVAKRENNKKRNYLVVNRLQGKHVPVEPARAFEMFNALAMQIKDIYSEKILVIGFAETATAIGAAVAAKLQLPYMHTTRENIKDVDFLYFSEEHSHATEQRVAEDDIKNNIKNIERIIFVEDEVTTGNTILNIIKILKNKYPLIKNYSVASILNGMDENALNIYKEKNISIHYLVKTNHDVYKEMADSYVLEGKTYDYYMTDKKTDIQEYIFSSDKDTRRYTDMEVFDKETDRLYEEINKNADIKEGSLLVVGTEEFMYSALCIARKFEKTGMFEKVRSHSTTRSPITVCEDENYPLKERFALSSMYDKERKTYIYDLDKYDNVIIITDADDKYKVGKNSLVSALKQKGCEKIYMFRWCKN